MNKKTKTKKRQRNFIGKFVTFAEEAAGPQFAVTVIGQVIDQELVLTVKLTEGPSLPKTVMVDARKVKATA
jgi:hypothetical protein